uniref:(northern house mosquito) hypothetical protein n=1 Tax=Culex pipiens TaxID=7175 RepID=A0A8D8CFZ2_CULPI
MTKSSASRRFVLKHAFRNSVVTNSSAAQFRQILVRLSWRVTRIEVHSKIWCAMLYSLSLKMLSRKASSHTRRHSRHWCGSLMAFRYIVVVFAGVASTRRHCLESCDDVVSALARICPRSTALWCGEVHVGRRRQSIYDVVVG